MLLDPLPKEFPGGDCAEHGPCSTASCPKCAARQRQRSTIPLLVGLAVALSLAAANHATLWAWLQQLAAALLGGA